MRGYLQTDYRFPRTFNDYGCNVRSLMGAYELLTGETLTVAEINEIRSGVVLKGYVSANMSVKLPGKVVEETFALKGKKVRCYDFGAKDPVGNVTFWGWVQKEPEVAFTIIKGFTKRGNTHFKLGDKNGVEVFDPYPVETFDHVLQTILFAIEEL